MDKRLCVAFLEVRQRAIAAAFESDFSALAGHIDIRVAVSSCSSVVSITALRCVL